ncbi:hypothetical protein GCM10022408_23980 [Hymenobacter fastidiosus]|uniref:Secretion system C-terminal sorting domain-containing protein n=1 Tax=Hymenobacter fastidiosus TaxID=486264 RepID=A0ABP7SF05_9BACT
MKHLLPITFAVAALLAGSDSQAQSRLQAGTAKMLFGPEAHHPARPTAQRGSQPAGRSLRTTALSVPGRTVSHNWNETARRWENGQINTYTYNAQGRPTQQVYTDSVTNRPNGRNLLSYNAQGLETEYLSQFWSGTAYVNGYRYQTTYDAKGEETLSVSQEWINNAWKTQYSSRYTNTYNPAGLLVSQVQEELAVVTNTWQPDGRQTYTYNAANQLTGLLYEDWDSGRRAYVNEERIRNIAWYDWSKKLPSYYEAQQWDAASSTWESDERSTITYQANGSTLEIGQVMTAPNVWANNYRSINNNDNFGNNILSQGDDWVNSGWVIDYSYRYLLSYTAANLVRREVEQQYDTDDKRFENQRVTSSSNFVTLGTRRATDLEAAASLYPNPTQRSVMFNVAGLREQGPVPADVTNTLGQVVSTLTLPVQQGRINQELNLASLPAGIYTLRLHTSEGIVAKQVVKQ